MNPKDADNYESNFNNDYWRLSKVAAVDKAKELGIDIMSDWDYEDLRYAIYLALQKAI